jgi:N-formylglutamate amidohydrolase
MREPARAALMLEDRYADLLGRAIAQETGATLLIAEAPRAMLDLNRAPDDVDWSMVVNAPGTRASHSLANRRARSGLGLIPRRLARMGEVWKQPTEHGELLERLAAVHTPYHAVLSQTLGELCDRWGAALLIDLHSMPPVTGHNFPGGRPHLVVGDRFGASCGAELTGFALSYLARTRRVAHNLPYSGGYILDRHGAPKRAMHALQIEVCRSTYLDADMREVGARFAAIARELAGFVRAIADEVVWLGRPHASLAAE